jgi:hypothetical protein
MISCDIRKGTPLKLSRMPLRLALPLAVVSDHRPILATPTGCQLGAAQ